MLLVAASIAEGIPVDLREAALCMDGVNAARAAQAVCHAAGRRVQVVTGGWPVSVAALPGTVVITRPRHPLEGRELRVLGGCAATGGWSCCWCCPMAAAADPRGVDQPAR